MAGCCRWLRVSAPAIVSILAAILPGYTFLLYEISMVLRKRRKCRSCRPAIANYVASLRDGKKGFDEAAANDHDCCRRYLRGEYLLQPTFIEGYGARSSRG